MIIIFYFKYPIFSLFLIISGNTGFHYKFDTIVYGSPLPSHPARVNVYSKRLQLPALLRYTGSWGRGGGGCLPGVVHILGLLGFVHTSITGKTILRNLCLRNILFVNTSQSVSNSLNIIIRLHCLRLYIQYLVQWRHIVTSSVDSLF